MDKRSSKRSRSCGQNKQITFHGTPELQSGGVNHKNRYSEEYVDFFSNQIMNETVKVSLNVFPSFRSGTQYLIFIYVNNNKREEQRQVLRLNFTEIEFPKNLDWIASKSFDARMKGFIETSKIFLSFLLCSQGILICSCFAAATVKSGKFEILSPS